jgi:hypothetical protein
LQAPRVAPLRFITSNKGAILVAGVLTTNRTRCDAEPICAMLARAYVRLRRNHVIVSDRADLFGKVLPLSESSSNDPFMN